MTERPEPVSRLDLLFSASRIAQEATFDLPRELASVGRDDERRRDPLAESARIALEDLPAVTAQARRLGEQWKEQLLLDPARAAQTLRALEAELERIGPQLRRLRLRHRDVAHALRSRGGGASALAHVEATRAAAARS